jgi:hypothetical protein
MSNACQDVNNNGENGEHFSSEYIDGYGNIVGCVLDPAVLGREIELSNGKNKEDKRWPTKRLTIQNLFFKLAKHDETSNKNGPAFLQGEAIDGQRAAKSMRRLWLAGLDVDCADDIRIVVKRLIDLKVYAFAYTTFSHTNTSTDVVESSYAAWAKAEASRPANPTLESIAQFLVDKGKLSPALSQTVKDLRRDMTARGVVHRVSHDPAPRFRIVFPLAQPFEFLKDGATQNERLQEWKFRLYALADLVGVVMDESCVDPSRLFYFPAHAPGRQFETYLVGGESLLDIEALAITDAVKQKAGGGDKKSSGRKPRDGQRDARATADDASTEAEWYARDWTNWREWAQDYQAADLMRDYSYARRDVDANKVEIECAFDHEHSNAGDPEDRAGYVINGDPATGKTFVIGCQHASCKARKTSEFLQQMITADWFPEGADILRDPTYAKTLPITKADVLASELDRIGKLVDAFTGATPRSEIAAAEAALAAVLNDAPVSACNDLIAKIAKACRETVAKVTTRINGLAKSQAKRAAKAHEAERAMKEAAKATLASGGRVFKDEAEAVAALNQACAVVTMGGKTRVARLDLSPIEFMTMRDAEDWFSNWQALRANDDETKTCREFTLEGRGHRI